MIGQDLKFLIEMVIFERLIFKNDTNNDRSEKIVELFAIEGEVKEIKPLGNGLINDTYKVVTEGARRITCCRGSTTRSSRTWICSRATSRP